MSNVLSTSAQRVQTELKSRGMDCQVMEMSQTTRSAADAAKAVGCTVGQIAKSLVFKRMESERAVLVVTDSRLNLEAEPRIKRAATADPPKATHPFFWAGYLLVDSGTRPEREEPAPKQPAVKLQAPQKRQLQPAAPP